MLNRNQLKKLLSEKFEDDDDAIADREAQKFMDKKAPYIIEQAILLVRDLKAAKNFDKFDGTLDRFIRFANKQLGRETYGSD